MKRKLVFLIMLATMCAVSIPELMAQNEVCSKCGGSGREQYYSNIDKKYYERTCSNCNGKGYAKAIDNSWRLYLTQQELQAVSFLEDAMREPYYVNTPCKACESTGKCPACHGSGYAGPYFEVCRLCSGSGICIGCRGVGSHRHIEENPNMENFRKQWTEFVKLGMERQRKQM